MQAITLDSARQLLRDSASVLDATYEVGLSGPGRLHDLFVTHEAMSPGEWKSGGEGLTMRLRLPSLAVRQSAGHGDASAGWPGSAFADPGEGGAALRDMQRALAEGELRRGHRGDRADRAAHLRSDAVAADQPLRVVMIGTDFEVRVWETLLGIPMGRARHLFGHRRRRSASRTAARAVGAAVGKNPICFVVPCHRVIGKSGDITGYHWGLTRKRAMLGWEAGKSAAA